MKKYYKIDFEKVKTIEDIKIILKACDFTIIIYDEDEIKNEILDVTKFLKKEN